MTLAENLKALRTEKGLSQEEVAGALFLSRQSVSKWENGQAEPGVENLKALARLYGVSLDRLLLAEGEPPAPAEPGTGSHSPVEAPAMKWRAERAYLIWTSVLMLWYAAETVFTMVFFGPGNGSAGIPLTAIAMVVGIWVRYPAMWVVDVCLFGLNLLTNVMSLSAGRVAAAAGLAVNGVCLWMLIRPAMRKRFGMKR